MSSPGRAPDAVHHCIARVGASPGIAGFNALIMNDTCKRARSWVANGLCAALRTCKEKMQRKSEERRGLRSYMATSGSPTGAVLAY